MPKRRASKQASKQESESESERETQTQGDTHPQTCMVMHVSVGVYELPNLAIECFMTFVFGNFTLAPHSPYPDQQHRVGIFARGL